MIVFNPIEPVTKKYICASSEISRVFSCEWDDTIHDSYFRYVRFCDNTANRLRSYSSSIDHIINQLNEFNIEKVIEESEELHKKISEIVKQ